MRNPVFSLSSAIKTVLVLYLFFAAIPGSGQQKDSSFSEHPNLPDTATRSRMLPVGQQLDLIDILERFIGKDPAKRQDTSNLATRLKFSAIPALGYTLLTGFAVIAATNVEFNTSSEPQPNASNVLASVTYSQYHQILLPIQSNIWSGNDKYNFQSDWRYLKYPSYTYGLGGYTLPKDAYAINYDYLRFYQIVSRFITNNVFAGVGYDMDYLWNIEEIDPPKDKQTDFEKYGFYPIEKASGVTLDLLYDSRGNPINPLGGSYAHATYRSNYTFMGSTNNWQSLQIDLRQYFKLSSSNDNILAFWSFDWFTTEGTPPYLLLPSTGWDPYNNTGRGYIQGRFRGKDMLYLESEYRFGITRNGLIGGVVFVNAESFSEITSGEFQVVEPGAGLGLRVKLNKYSRTNLAVDYGFGVGGSQGFAVNLGEIF